VLKVVGAGLGRTGTNSLKLALEQLLGGRCYHMFELMRRDDDLPAWEAAARGEDVDWERLMADFVATVDWPAAAYWRELYAANPQARVLLSLRASTDEWWDSMSSTIVVALDTPVPADDPSQARRRAATREMLGARFTPDWRDGAAARAAYERHNQEVRDAVPADSLIEWRAGDGWGPICTALALPEPDEPFPHANTRADFRARVVPERAGS
jgi:sulfotransferase family protein